MTGIAGFWDSIYSQDEYSRRLEINVVSAAQQHFGDIRGKKILEIGCGPGTSAFYFASQGADVTGIDISPKAIDDMNRLCQKNNIDNVRGICANAFDLRQVGSMDYVFGSMILHHIEPFRDFVKELRNTLKPGGRAFFYENNAASRGLVWFRQNVVGRWWVPKYGDPDEFPLTPQEVDLLRQQFHVEIRYPEMLFFRLISTYLLRGKISGPFYSLDNLFYRRAWMLRYSYRQYLLIS